MNNNLAYKGFTILDNTIEETPKKKSNRGGDRRSGMITTKQPIKDINLMKSFLTYWKNKYESNPYGLSDNEKFIIARNQLLITVGCNTAYRSYDLTHLTWRDLLSDQVRKHERKTGKSRKVSINPQIRNAIEFYKSVLGISCDDIDKSDYIFVARRKGRNKNRFIERDYSDKEEFKTILKKNFAKIIKVKTSDCEFQGEFELKEDYISLVKEVTYKGEKSEKVFQNILYKDIISYQIINHPITHEGLSKMLKTMCKEIGIDTTTNEIGCHTLRKNFAYWYYMNNRNDQRVLAKLQNLLNHSSPSITLKYIGISDDEMHEMYNEVGDIFQNIIDDSYESNEEYFDYVRLPYENLVGLIEKAYYMNHGENDFNNINSLLEEMKSYIR